MVWLASNGLTPALERTWVSLHLQLLSLHSMESGI